MTKKKIKRLCTERNKKTEVRKLDIKSKTKRKQKEKSEGGKELMYIKRIKGIKV